METELKIKIVCNTDNYQYYKTRLEISGFIVSDDANLLFVDLDYEEQNLVAKKDGDLYQIHITDIYYVESFGHVIIIHLEKHEYSTNDRLFRLELILEKFGFIRINRSQILNTKKIKKMRPLLNYRIKVILTNNDVVYVTRGYYQIFKEYMGI